MNTIYSNKCCTMFSCDTVSFPIINIHSICIIVMKINIIYSIGIKKPVRGKSCVTGLFCFDINGPFYSCAL